MLSWYKPRFFEHYGSIGNNIYFIDKSCQLFFKLKNDGVSQKDFTINKYIFIIFKYTFRSTHKFAKYQIIKLFFKE